MELSDALQRLLLADATLVQDLGSRVYVGKVPDKDRGYPLALLHMAAENSQELLEGGSCGMFEQDVQLDFYATDKLAIDRLRKRLRQLMPCAKRTITAGTDSFVVHGIVNFHVQMANVWESELGLWRMISDFVVMHQGGGDG